MVYPEAPFRLGPSITGKVRGEYNFAYLSRQACRKLKRRKQKDNRPSCCPFPEWSSAAAAAAAAAEEMS
eukprot:6112965-Amphidinium_carterae.1